MSWVDGLIIGWCITVAIVAPKLGAFFAFNDETAPPADDRTSSIPLET